jgi:hypothetical protein
MSTCAQDIGSVRCRVLSRNVAARPGAVMRTCIPTLPKTLGTDGANGWSLFRGGKEGLGWRSEEA